MATGHIDREKRAAHADLRVHGQEMIAWLRVCREVVSMYGRKDEHHFKESALLGLESSKQSSNSNFHTHTVPTYSYLCPSRTYPVQNT